MSGEEKVVTEVPSSLKQLARLVVRGFYTIEDALIVDMLVRNPCMKEDDICELLKFERKMLRARISTLRNDKFIQVRLRMETGFDGKAQKVNYYFINYKTFVNVVKYKLDLMRKRMETEERDATSRASFKCTNCLKTFTDLEADQLFDMSTGEFRCTFCREIVEEDQSALPKKDSRLLLAKFNEQLEPLYILLRAVEGIKLAPEILEPEPVDINTIRGIDTRKPSNLRAPNEQWSGEATRTSGFMVEDTRVDVTIGDESSEDNAANRRKERPIWMMESTVINADGSQADGINTQETILDKAAATATNTTTTNTKQGEDIMSVLLAHEKKGGTNSTTSAIKAVLPQESSDSSDNEEINDMQTIDTGEVETMDSEDDDLVPTVSVAGKSVAITDVNDTLIAEMTPTEKEAYIQVYQEYYSHMYD
ncbi:general transcription factor IIE subunit 1-like [Vespa mandarinia]|uniref:general transcription factor IIE subunit 1-like n=1 Tax=Vespa mandarinia TaxID=7446 RepID=UPI0016159259|nr:general transcription factor IIE subunit 1-like [Vespa mandarinia]XP_035722580.1 general transcription factor IIE subunit 1-like [Vespa mandarinia]XP_046817883.1 general transcription factor IIE subunit 1 [Vespa crabro]XP_046817884.1 general transcription factor IIE subunit 1 [Vespa crabro]XP_047350954.1 general transcription factor IIE subunit 1 [Vespa velutina]XP_047350955.1 general transcription factor IIE subunit 1 [Vespa velutina]